MKLGLRKFALTTHVTSSVGWLGTVIAYVALAIAAQISQDTQMVRAAWIAMELIGWYVIVPLALVSLLTGLIISLGTSWGLFRHYWVLFKLLLTVLSTIVLLLHMPLVSSLAGVAKTDSDLGELPSELFHPGIGLLVLLVIVVLSVYKPRGMTRYGWRKQQEQRNVLKQ
ncbi:membrane protein [Priestia megaterium]|nr:membrane protein [Priestia megaterium]